MQCTFHFDIRTRITIKITSKLLFRLSSFWLRLVADARLFIFKTDWLGINTPLRKTLTTLHKGIQTFDVTWRRFKKGGWVSCVRLVARAGRDNNRLFHPSRDSDSIQNWMGFFFGICCTFPPSFIKIGLVVLCLDGHSRESRFPPCMAAPWERWLGLLRSACNLICVNYNLCKIQHERVV